MWRWLIVVVVLAACQPPNETDSVSSESTALLTSCNPDQFSYRGTRKDFQCGVIPVAENPDALDGRIINLNVVRLPAVSPSSQPDPVFVLAGGPGQASTEIVAGVVPWMRLVNRERDIIFVDQRGTGKSNPLDCDEDSEPDYSLSSKEQQQRQTDALRSCLQGYDADVQFYTTPFAADDINHVADSLGYEKYNLWGASYGTRLGLEILRRHPNRVRSAVLDSVAPLANPLPQFMLADGDRALKLIFSQCEAQVECRENFPDLQNRLTQLIRQLNNSPQQVTITHPLLGTDTTITLDGQVVSGLLRLGMYSREIGPTIPLMIDAAANGNFLPFITLMGMSEDVGGGISMGLQFSILCTEDIARAQNPQNLENSILQLNSFAAMREVCAFWPEGKLPDNYFDPIESDNPVLLLSGEIDPVTPPRWGTEAAQYLNNSLHIEVPGAHHGSSVWGCVPDIIDDFYRTLDWQQLSTDCVNDIKPLAPFVSVAGPAMQSDIISDAVPQGESQ